ncbi:IS21 family transposase (plasmid) [Sulfitobacter sp. SK012]|uniref:IS21 family transposase n=1 Tax=Sulfitobacter sp. SK012 TaxID=1389005 RepID=UPI000E0A399F|nr:IS21 family transposase [Sulfitobacter sp. SK012]AXI44566.1 IS21 family transposase [Sulfitobacter sp. SK012]AXI46356.1 IS21 family transposase [Sulfitobacter sp. SK012]AXI46458.1 IS21 family transposase [Sulfitobacter sp. SK012]AXI46526.1 IS21 family transposase [Sulfitobacter sp. SK012]AXI47548.1 IS21 family transposase [Sulfitobacter sp. SK012]
MYSVDLYSRVRRACHVEGKNNSEAARLFGIDRKTVAKILKHSVPPGYQRTTAPVRPKLDPFIGIIDQILKDDKRVIKKQRHTAKRIHARLRDEHGFTGGITIVTDYVREKQRRTQEVFVPLVHTPGHAQVDFGETLGVIGGVERKLHYIAISLPHSDAFFMKAYPAETTEAFCDGHNAAFAFFGGVPLSALYDNTVIAVAKILGGGKRIRTRTFSELQSHYLFEDRFGRPGKGNDKGNVEGVIGYGRRNFLIPAPRFDSFDALNAWLEEQCLKRQDDVVRGHSESIGERLLRDLDALMALPPTPYDACDKVSTRATSISMIRYRNNDYSVPVAFAHHEVQVRGYVHEVVIGCGTEIVARHRRSYEKADMIFDPMHYLPLLEQKVGALDQAAPLQGWDLPDAFTTLHRLLEARMGKAGKREYVQILRLLETFEMEHVHAAIKQALDLGALGYDAIKHLILCRIERRPPRLDLDIYPYLPKAVVETTKPSSYAVLLSEVAA